MNIAIVDYLVTANNPAGSCHRLLVQELANDHKFTVFAHQFDNPLPGIVEWIRVPAIIKPLLALFLSFHLGSLLKVLFSRRRFTVLQGVESNFGLSDVVYAHFCHRRFLKKHWDRCRPSGLRRPLRWVDHYLHSLLEPFVFRRARWIVVPSAGLARELEQEYPFAAKKIQRIANPVDLSAFDPAPDFDREIWRTTYNLQPSDRVVVFVALGHFERKGLHLLLQAMSQLSDPSVKLHIVGGTRGMIARYRNIVRAMGLEDAVRFAGHQADVRPFLWSADLFALPSYYEVFPLAALQAAAASIPLLVTRLSGVEDYLTPNKSHIEVEASVNGVKKGLLEFCRMSDAERLNMGAAARLGVAECSVEKFSSRWRAFYAQVSESCPNG